MKLSGIMPLRNAVLLAYPFDLAIRSLQAACDEVVVLVDPTSTDDTRQRCAALGVVLVESEWDMTNHDGRNDEIARQTGIALAAATGDWVLSLQADEVLHAAEIAATRSAIDWAEEQGITGLEMTRVYFYGGLDRYRDNWTFQLLRLFKRGAWRPDPQSGAMQFVPVGEQRKAHVGSRIFHYSRVGDPAAVARRVQNLDHFYHSPDRIRPTEAIAPYDYGALRKLDTYVEGTVAEEDTEARLVEFPLDGHPPGVVEHFR